MKSLSCVSAHVPGDALALQDSVSSPTSNYDKMRALATKSTATLARMSCDIPIRSGPVVPLMYWLVHWLVRPPIVWNWACGCGTVKDEDGALEWWSKIADLTHPEYAPSTSRPIRTKALSCMANAYLERSNVDQDTLQIDDLYRAGTLADACASFGLVTPIVLSVASRIEKVGLRRQADCRFRGTDTTRFELLEFLLAAFEARSAEIQAGKQKRDTKTAKAPNLYQCAAEGCGIGATKRYGLSRCAGRCLPDVKPTYCSKDCQRADWKRHRVVCKGNIKTERKQTPPVASPSNVPEDMINPDKWRNDGKELIMDWPTPDGGTMKVSSKTMTPAFMKEVKGKLEMELERVSDGTSLYAEY